MLAGLLNHSVTEHFFDFIKLFIVNQEDDYDKHILSEIILK